MRDVRRTLRPDVSDAAEYHGSAAGFHARGTLQPPDWQPIPSLGMEDCAVRERVRDERLARIVGISSELKDDVRDVGRAVHYGVSVFILSQLMWLAVTACVAAFAFCR